MITKKTPWPALILCFICSAICAAGLLAATGDDCNDPIIIDIPGDLPYADTDQSTCGRGNNYSNTCLGEYDGGEDIIYELTLDVGSYIEITLDPGPSTWTGIAIDDSCPLAPTTCIAESTISTATVHGIECSYFDAGTYYIMIDTFPSPTCIPTFTLTITECVAPVGACCVETDCVANTTNSECINIYGGEWHSGEDCATFTCPASIGESSDLATAIAGLPYSANFDNDLSSADGPGGTCDKYAPVTIMQNDVWFVWTAGENCVATATLTSSYDAIMTIRDDCVELAELECADDAVAAGVEEIVFCASNGTTYYFQVGDTGSAEGGGNNLFELVCEPATVGACCFSDGSCSEMDQLDCIAASGDFQGTGTTCDPNPCSQPVPGDTCLLPIQVSIPGDLPFTDLDQYTCGRTDDYDETCLGYYDGGEDIIYELNVTVAIVVSISMDPRGTSYTGLAVDDGCPPDATCMAVHTNPGGSVHGISNLSLSPGMYYLIIDTWAAPDCVPEFDLTIGTYVPPTGACCQEDGSCSVEIPGDCSVMGGIYQGDDSVCDPNPCSIPEIGDNCSVPIQVGSADLPFTDVAQTNCGRINKYNDTCLGDYDGGEDIIYELALDADTWIEITLDSGTTAYTGIALDDSCPLDTVACIAKSTLIGAGVHGIDCIFLAAGTHYVMVDTWPAPSCIPDFNLTIAECSPSTGACCVAGSCVATNNGMECLALGGSWFEGSTCPDFTCPDPRGNDCLDPIPVTAPAALPYTDAHQTTCGRDNDYTETCLGTFDTGEDIMYELTVTGEVCVDIGVSTTGPFYSGSVGIALGSACPPGAPCIAYDTAGTGEFGTALTSQILAAGVYYIMVDTDGSPACVETFTLTIGECPISPPANDLCEDAWQIVSPYPSIVSGTTKGATVDCAGVLDWTAVWYKFNLGTAKNLLTIDYCETGEDISTIGAIVYPEPIDPPSACPSDCNTYILRTAINWVECPNGCTNPVLTFLLDGPATYYLPVYARQGSGLGVDFSFTVSVEDVSVPNDDCDNATAIDEVTDLAFDTTYATFDGGGICMTGPNLWYCFTSPCDGLVQVSLLGSGYDTKLAVYDGCGCDPPGTELDCNDDFSGLQSLISFEAVQGQSYLIEVGGYSTHVGQGILNVSCPAPIPALSPIGIFALLCGLGLTLRRALRRRG